MGIGMDGFSNLFPLAEYMIITNLKSIYELKHQVQVCHLKFPLLKSEHHKASP